MFERHTRILYAFLFLYATGGVLAESANKHILDLSKAGVVCDGVVDDAPAINAALKTFRSRFVSAFAIEGKVVFPPGNCLVRNSIDLTNLKSKSVVIDGAGARIVGEVKMGIVIDAVGSQFLKIRDLTISTGRSNLPKIGLLIGRSGSTTDTSGDNIQLDGVSIAGSFELAALYNLNSETSIFNHLVLVNESDNSESFALVQDGINHFGIMSQYVKISQPEDKSQSFNENLFLDCDIRHNGAGVPVWIAHVTRHEFVRSYIASLHATSALQIYSSGKDTAITQLKLDIHFETKALLNAISFVGPQEDVLVRGLSITDQFVGARQSVLSRASNSRVKIENLELDLADLPETSVVFDKPDAWLVSGRVYVGSIRMWNLPKASFSGILTVGLQSYFKGLVLTPE